MEGIDYNDLFDIEGQEGQEGAQEGLEGQEETRDDDQETGDLEEEEGLEDDQDGGEGQRKPDAEGTRRRTEPAGQEAQEAAKKAVDDAFRNSGLVNPYTKQPIRSKAEYDAYKQQFEAERKAQMLKKSGMSEEEFQKFVQDQPEVKAAREAQAKAEAEARQFREQQARQKVEAQVKEISAMDPSIQSLGDLAKMENYPEFYGMVQRGYSLTDAFKLVNFDRLTQSAAAGARQAARNAAAGKEHLGRTAGRGKGGVSVPAEVREAYRMLNPKATDAEIQAHYAKYKK